ncbi:hypothetical protein F5J12DRAFT_236529 [Pisolithus orientalis]|uniref:uncharacterized protein n=1 Tax=Pisolithus orientalis TaxID=936130 RepID=UPI00222588C3|nr:uncharacterized protein F5J12DRAFT_236529 [Pisolithus orientalis]KAI6001561.1 hypothetical protein F5J12DRAFT_236529 [Pisolithus orientalis]
MSDVSPKPAPSQPQPTMTSPPAPSNGAVVSTHAQLAALLAASYQEKESLQKELVSARKRLESLDRQLAAFSKSSSSSSPNASSAAISDVAQRYIQEAELRAERAELARDEADARSRVITEAWEELHRYLATLDFRSQDARAGFARIMAEGGGQLVLAPPPAFGSHHSHYPLHTPPSATSPAIMLIPPSQSRSHHRHSSTPSSHPPSATSHPPPQNASPSRVRPRSNSFDDQSPYLSAPGQPPAKRHRSDRGEYDHHPHLNSSSLRSRGRPTDIDVHAAHRSSHRDLASPHLSVQPTSYVHRPSHVVHSRSSSRSSQHSLSIDEMLLEASTDDPRPRNNEPPSPRVVLAHHQHPTSHHNSVTASSRGLVNTPTVGPLEQPGELRTYQTHVFAPPVTGAPTKKGKMSLANGAPTLPTPSNTSTSSTAPPQTPTTSHPLASSTSANLSHPHPHHVGTAHGHPQQQPPQPTVHRTPAGTYPPTNSLGQRICRQCGLVGRYKEGKCVEKWGPGPEGPGTVCDRCRKKMKRVERRGTLGGVGGVAAGNITSGVSSVDQQIGGQHQGGNGVNQLTHAHTMPARVSRSDTVPAHVLPSASVGNGDGNGGGSVGPTGTRIIGSAAFGGKRDRDRDRYPVSQPHSPHPYAHGQSQGLSPSQRPTTSGYATTSPPSATGSKDPTSTPGTAHRPSSIEGHGQTSLPSPPAIATLPLDDDCRPSAPARSLLSSPPSGSGTGARASVQGPRSVTGALSVQRERDSRQRAAGTVKARGRASDSSSGSGSVDVDADADADGEDADADGEDADADPDADPDAETRLNEPDNEDDEVMKEHDNGDEGEDADKDAEMELLKAVDAAEKSNVSRASGSTGSRAVGGGNTREASARFGGRGGISAQRSGISVKGE